MGSARNPGRVVGLWYLLLVLGGPLSLIYIPNKLFVQGDAAAKARNIAARDALPTRHTERSAGCSHPDLPRPRVLPVVQGCRPAPRVVAGDLWRRDPRPHQLRERGRPRCKDPSLREG